VGALVLLQRSLGRDLRLTLPTAPSEVDAFCEFSGLKHLLGGPAPNKTHPANQTVAIRQHTKASFLDATPLTDLVRRHLSTATEDHLERLQICMNELIQNVVDHSKSIVGGVSCARLVSKEIRVGVTDLGIGIAESLRQRFEVRDELEALERIARDERLSARSRPNNAGLGLSHLRSIIEDLGGTLTLLSGCACGIVRPGQPGWSITKVKVSFPGTAVFFSLPMA
jgi:signal transduction histidine kinase